MKVPRHELEKLLAGMEAKLLVAVEDQEVIKECTGLWLQSQGIFEFKTKAGILAPVDPGQKYEYSITRKVTIDHRKRMKTIVDQARNQEDLHEKLAAYLVKYGNPANFQTSKN